MNTADMQAAIADAKRTINAADNTANQIAEILPGRLRHVSRWTLQKLKRELRDFNIHTGKWRRL